MIQPTPAETLRGGLRTRQEGDSSDENERVRAAELRAVIEAMGEAVLVCEGAGDVSLVNPAAETMFAGRPVRTYDDLVSRLIGPSAPPIDPILEAAELHLIDRPNQWVELRV